MSTVGLPRGRAHDVACIVGNPMRECRGGFHDSFAGVLDMILTHRPRTCPPHVGVAHTQLHNEDAPCVVYTMLHACDMT